MIVILPFLHPSLESVAPWKKCDRERSRSAWERERERESEREREKRERERERQVYSMTSNLSTTDWKFKFKSKTGRWQNRNNSDVINPTLNKLEFFCKKVQFFESREENLGELLDLNPQWLITLLGEKLLTTKKTEILIGLIFFRVGRWRWPWRDQA